MQHNPAILQNFRHVCTFAVLVYRMLLQIFAITLQMKYTGLWLVQIIFYIFPDSRMFLAPQSELYIIRN